MNKLVKVQCCYHFLVAVICLHIYKIIQYKLFLKPNNV